MTMPAKRTSALRTMAVLATLSAIGPTFSACSPTRDRATTGRHDVAVAAVPKPPENRPGDIPAPLKAGEAPLDSLKFLDVTAAAGLEGAQSDAASTRADEMTSGVAVADVDGDGDQDVFIPRVGKPNALFINDGSGHFTDMARAAGVAGPIDRFGSATAVFSDFDEDGHLDLFVAGAGQGSNELFMNNGDGTFREDSAARGLLWPPVPDVVGSQTHGTTVADVNGDGHMDLLVLHWTDDLIHGSAAQQLVGKRFGAPESPFQGPPNCERAAALRAAGFPLDSADIDSRSALFLNDGAGHFSDATERLHLPFDKIVAFTGVFADLDGDGWQDLTVTGDFCTSRVFRNIGGKRFEDVTDTAGVGTDENGMGSVVRDVNGDGRPDWFITAISYPTAHDECRNSSIMDFGCSGNRLYLNQGHGHFTDATDQYGLRDGGWGWGAAVEDFDNSGALEFTMANGYSQSPTEFSSNIPKAFQDFFRTFATDTTRFWVRDRSTYRDAAVAVGIQDATIGHGLVPFDMDNDGDMDLIIAASGVPPRLYRNDTPGVNNWLTVRLNDSSKPGNAWGDGARIEVTPHDGDKAITGWITTGGSYESQKPPEFHLGLGAHPSTISQVKVFWPGSTTAQVVTDVTVNRIVTIDRR